MIEIPRSWESFENHPPLRRPTDEEWQIIGGAELPAEALTEAMAADLVVLYAKAVGYETEKQVKSCLSSAALWDYLENRPSVAQTPLNTSPYSDVVSWRLGSPDWVNTKFVIRRPDDQPDIMRVSLSPNTHLDQEEGWTDRDIGIMTYFGEMAAGYLALTLEE